MTTPDPGPTDDAKLDARVRAAADVPFDDIAVTEAVLARVHATRRTIPAEQRKGWAPILAPTAFASVLLATPFIVAGYPTPGDGADAFLFSLASGDPLALIADAGLGPDLISVGLRE
ncbi:hypothetical protein [Tabrizicola sp.]|uniref:hypothetical protein n=1 Tax=Tabrizicola sp. TaxID=2005166 RepID=UPI003F3304CB